MVAEEWGAGGREAACAGTGAGWSGGKPHRKRAAGSGILVSRAPAYRGSEWARAAEQGTFWRMVRLWPQLSAHSESRTVVGRGAGYCCRAEVWLLVSSSSGVLYIAGVPVISKNDHLPICFTCSFLCGRSLPIHLFPL